MRIRVNRAPVLTLWAVIVAERLGYERNEALTLGRALAGLNAQSKGRALGIFHPAPVGKRARAAPTAKLGDVLQVPLMQRAIPAVRTKDGLRALEKDRPSNPESVVRYLTSKFGDGLEATRDALFALAASIPRKDLDACAFGLYESFRPKVPPGTRGWGAAGILDLNVIRSLARGR